MVKSHLENAFRIISYIINILPNHIYDLGDSVKLKVLCQVVLVEPKTNDK